MLLTYSMQVMNTNFRPKKCSGQSRYGRYGSYATAIQVHINSDSSGGATLLDSGISVVIGKFKVFTFPIS